MKLTYYGRKRMRRSQFALTPTTTQRRRGIKGRYPINDKAHARNALARVSSFGTRTEKATVRRKVYNRYPSLRK